MKFFLSVAIALGYLLGVAPLTSELSAQPGIAGDASAKRAEREAKRAERAAAREAKKKERARAKDERMAKVKSSKRGNADAPSSVDLGDDDPLEGL
jgi:hypothetical protein